MDGLVGWPLAYLAETITDSGQLKDVSDLGSRAVCLNVLYVSRPIFDTIE